jgi:ribose transport system substrate-binding protein
MTRRDAMFKRWVGAALLALAVSAFAGCGSNDGGGGSSAAGGSTTKVKKIAFFGFASANSFAQATYAGVKEEAAKKNIEV